MKKNIRIIRSVLLFIGVLLAFMPRILGMWLNISLSPTSHTIVFILAVVLLISGMVLNSKKE